MTTEWKLVPVTPTDEQSGGLARDIVMWWSMTPPTGYLLHRHIRALHGEVPQWLADLIPDREVVPPKGAVACAIYRAMLNAAPAAPVQPDGWVLAPHYRGYAKLGVGAYVLNVCGGPVDPDLGPELIISIATNADKAGGRQVGEDRPNAPGSMIEPEAMAVRIGFASVAGLDVLERKLRELRAEGFPDSAAGPVQQAEPVVWVDVHDRDEGPYEFHGRKLLDAGAHDLYLHPPAAEVQRPDVAIAEAFRCGKESADWEAQRLVDALTEIADTSWAPLRLRRIARAALKGVKP